MVFFKDLFPLFDLHPPWKSSLNSVSATLLSRLNDSMPGATCSSGELETCRDDSAALTLKLVSIVAILLAGAVGIAIPILGKHRKFLRTESNLFVAAKAFAAGVILATGFVHMLSDASSSLSDPCLPAYPWTDFPFAGFFAMCSALLTLLADFVGTQVYERKQRRKRLGGATDPAAAVGRVGSSELYGISAEQLPVSVVEVDKEEVEEDGNGNQNRKETCAGGHCRSGKVFGEEADGGMHIVGIRAHAAHHRHSHSHGQKGCDAHVVDMVVPSGSTALGHGHGGEEDGDCDDHFGHSHVHGGVEEDNQSRHVVVSQVLELGIVSHSVIIGLSLGVSHSPCTIRPLMGALSFHQFFEGFALGGCISQAHLQKQATTIMACFFALTTPAGIGAGIAVASTYNSSSARALIIEGILDSVSAGILIYMALVDLIAADFLSKRMRCNVRLQVVSYLALFVGAGLMSLLAIWA